MEGGYGKTMSTNKTKNYQLHSWEAADDFLREEFNENFAALDEVIHEQPITGSYIGTYAGSGSMTPEDQTITLGFTPRIVLVVIQAGNMENYTGGLAFQDSPVKFNSRVTVSIIENGFQAHSDAGCVGANSSGKLYHYIAF